MVRLNYGRMMQRAMQGLVAEALLLVSRHGLEQPHHFYITLQTAHPGVEMPDWLRAQFPKEMVIVLQHEYEDLNVDEDHFSVQLSFSNRPATLKVPFDAVLQFADPSAEFGLRFDPPDDEDEDDEDESHVPQFGRGPMLGAPSTFEGVVTETSEPDDDRADSKDAQIVDLDAFRKK